MKKATLGQLAELVCGEVSGDADLEVTGASPLADVESGQITLIDSRERLATLSESSAAAAVVAADARPEELPAIVVGDIHKAFAAIVEHFRPRRAVPERGISPRAIIARSAQLGDDLHVGDGATIGDDVTIGAHSTVHTGVHIMPGCRIGEHATLFPGVILYEDTVVADRVTIHAGTVIGASGFGYHLVEGQHELAAQLGYVEIESDVDIGANCAIDRGTYGRTLIGTGTKIDNLVQIAHNCRLGRHNLICSQVGIAGSTTTGDYVVMAGQVGVRDHVHIGTGAVLGAKAGISNNVEGGTRMIGIPATPERDQKLKQAAFSKLPEMRRQLKALQRSVDQFGTAPVVPTESSER